MIRCRGDVGVSNRITRCSFVRASITLAVRVDILLVIAIFIAIDVSRACCQTVQIQASVGHLRGEATREAVVDVGYAKMEDPLVLGLGLGLGLILTLIALLPLLPSQ